MHYNFSTKRLAGVARLVSLGIGLAFMFCLFVNSVNAASIVDINKAELAEIIKNKPDTIIVDLRTPDEYKENALPGAVNVDFNSPDFANKVRELANSKKSQDWIVYCRSGRRSANALPVLSKELPGTIYHLEKGIKE